MREIEPEITDQTTDVLTAGPDGQLVVGGRVPLNRAGKDVLLPALPPVGHVPSIAAKPTRLRVIDDQLVDEVSAARDGIKRDRLIAKDAVPDAARFNIHVIEMLL